MANEAAEQFDKPDILSLKRNVKTINKTIGIKWKQIEDCQNIETLIP